MPDHSCSSCCDACRKLPELLALASTIQIHDSRLEGLLCEIESLIPPVVTSEAAGAAPPCGGHLAMLVELQPKLQRIYESLLLQKHELRRSISELEMLHCWAASSSNDATRQAPLIVV